MKRDEIAKDNLWDTNLGFLNDPYRFFSHKLKRYNTDALESKLLFFKDTLILRGEEGAKLFYNKDIFSRTKTMPGHVKKPLFGRGTIHGTDHSKHEERKQLFLSILNPENIIDFPEIFERTWFTQIRRWQKKESIVLLDEISEVLCRAICEWAEFDLPEEKVSLFTRYNRAMVEGIGKLGPAHWYSRYARVRAEIWVGAYLSEIRSGKKQVSKESAAYQVAHYQEEGKLLDPRQAAVTLLNVLRPAIASARFIVFGALSLHEHPGYRTQLKEEYFQEWFAHEIRRYYPFVPGMVARARKDFVWREHRFKKNTFALLDIYGTNHDPATWKDPDKFLPERFRRWDGSPYNFIPQGGGTVEENHRCPGEWLTVEILKKSMWFLSEAMEYDVPGQDLSIDFHKLITEPKSGFVMSNIRKALFH